MTSGEVIWRPSAERAANAVVSRFAVFAGRYGAPAGEYAAVYDWSVRDLDAFWRALIDFFGVVYDGDASVVLADRAMPGASWFPDVSLSYPEHVFRGRSDSAIAVQHASELRGLQAVSWRQLQDQTARIRAGLRRLGVGRGDRVAAYLPNIPEALAAFLATASLGAVWSSCSPDFGVRSVVDRFAQIEPKVLLAVDGYRYGGRDYPRRQEVTRIAAQIPSLERVVTLGYLESGGDWDAVFTATAEPLVFERVAFDHPLVVLYSSGTTGLPKAIIHGHGGLLVEHLKWLAIHADAQAGDRVFWFTTTGWMMWNALVGALLTPASVILYDGNPMHPDPGVLWDLAARTGMTLFGTGAAYIHGLMKTGIDPQAAYDLSALRSVGSTGSPLSPEGFQWVYEHVGADTWLFSTSGGTDVCSAFVGGVPTLPVRLGEIQARHLGCAVAAYDASGRPVIDAVGEMVITEPMPSMPVGFWNDADGARYHDAYFSMFPGVWRHGDWIRITPGGSVVIYGRSDSTINRGGVRMGTAEIYRAALTISEVTDALVVDVPDPAGAAEAWMGLFVVLADDATLTDAVTNAIRARIRVDCSPRHVPDAIIQTPAVPRTLSGKVLEVPVKRMLMGADPASVASRDSLADPAAFDWFAAYAAARRTDPPAVS